MKSIETAFLRLDELGRSYFSAVEILYYGEAHDRLGDN
jgi:hypothetical protein